MSVLEQIERLCVVHNITIYKLEKDTGVSQNTIRKWGTASPTCKAICLVADYFDVSVDYLLGRTSNSISHKDPNVYTAYTKIFKELDSHHVTETQVDALAQAIKSILVGFA